MALSTPFFIYRRRNNKGIALILTVGVLALLVLVGTSFAINMMADLKFTRNFENTAKAKYFAEAGINRAIAELLYGNEGFVSDAVDSSTEAWAGNNVFAANIGRGGYTVNKIYDCAGQICINDANPNLSVMLENLVAALGAPLAAGDGAAIAANRPANGYVTKEEITGILPGATLADKKAKYNKMADHITVQAFVDNYVINPLDLATPYAVTPRAPVNVNTASREVLIAVLTGISDGNNTVTAARAASLADHLINNRPYATYDQIWSALLSAETLGYIANGDAAIVMANANPNTDLMRANPNYSWRYKHVSRGNPNDATGYDSKGVPYAIDKTMLATHTTEFSFNSGGYYEINATGFVSDASGNHIAAKSMQAVVKLFDIWRQTTQAQFAQGTRSNVSLYPECPQVAAASYDGQVMLSMSPSTTPGNNPYCFRINFQDKTNNLNADAGGGDLIKQSAWMVQLNPNVASIVNAADPGNLFPDGLFLPRDDAVTNCWFHPDNNIDANDGTLEIWFKPNWHHKYVHFANAFNSGKLFEAQSRGTSGGPSWGNSEMDIYFAPNTDEVHCRIHNKNGSLYTMPMPMKASWKPGTWHHIAVAWDYEDFLGDPTHSQDFYTDGGVPMTYSIKDPPYQFLGDNGLEIGHDTPYQEPPDVTYGEVRIFSSNGATSIGTDYARGVYYDSGDAYFESSSPVSPIGPARLGTVSWTEHIADVAGNPVIPGVDITFDVYDGSTWLGNSSSRSNPAGNQLNVLTAGTGAIKYRAYFIETGDGLYDTPVLDDVTVTYQKRAKILYWRDI